MLQAVPPEHIKVVRSIHVAGSILPVYTLMRSFSMSVWFHALTKLTETSWATCRLPSVPREGRNTQME